MIPVATELSIGELPPMSTVIPLVAALLTATFVFSGSETAFFSMQDRDRRYYADAETATEHRVHRMLQHRTGLITTILMGNEISNMTLSALTAALIAVYAPDKPWLSIVVLPPVLILFSEITPKVIAFRYNRAWAELVVWPLTAIYYALMPLRLLLAAIVSLLARAFGVHGEPEESVLREEEFLVRVGQAADQGVVEQDERAFIAAVFDLDDVPIARLMTPRPDMFSLDIETPWPELLNACQEAGYSRVPIWEGDPDNVVGVLLIRDLLRHRRGRPPSPEALRAMLIPPVFVPGTRLASEMMREMLKRRIHMAFVVDEHGTIIGLVSLDDLIAELVGELGDEDDDGDSEPIEHTEGALTVDGAVDIDDFAEQTGLVIPEGEYHTVGGYVFHTLGRIPVIGDYVEAEGQRYEVLEMDGRRVSRVRVRASEPAGEVQA
ncbi:MAG TPA: hemolysin family protein [Myxococcota bacterium]|nr:hemolysin family protein [Myxococcota bacterium]